MAKVKPSVHLQGLGLFAVDCQHGISFQNDGIVQAPKVPIEAELNGDTNNDQKSMHVAKHSHEPNGNFSFAKLDDYNRCPKSQKLKVGLVDMPLSATCIQQFATCHLHAISAVLVLTVHSSRLVLPLRQTNQISVSAA